MPLSWPLTAQANECLILSFQLINSRPEPTDVELRAAEGIAKKKKATKAKREQRRREKELASPKTKKTKKRKPTTSDEDTSDSDEDERSGPLSFSSGNDEMSPPAAGPSGVSGQVRDKPSTIPESSSSQQSLLKDNKRGEKRPAEAIEEGADEPDVTLDSSQSSASKKQKTTTEQCFGTDTSNSSGKTYVTRSDIFGNVAVSDISSFPTSASSELDQAVTSATQVSYLYACL